MGQKDVCIFKIPQITLHVRTKKNMTKKLSVVLHNKIMLIT